MFQTIRETYKHIQINKITLRIIFLVLLIDWKEYDNTNSNSTKERKDMLQH